MAEPKGADLDRIAEALREAKTPARLEATAQLPAALEELDEWLADDRQWSAGFRRQWASLLDDLLASRAALGPSLARHFEQDCGPAWREIRTIRPLLKGDRGRWSPDPALRRRLRRALEAIRKRVLAPEALAAGWDDLCGAQDRPHALVEARRLLAFAAAQGHSVRLADRLREIVEDVAITIRVAREEETAGIGTLREPAGLPEAERIDLCRAVLREPPREGEVVVWLRYVLAPLGEDALITLSERVTLYSDAMLRAAIEAGDLDRLPPELRTDEAPNSLDVLIGGREDERAPEQEEDPPPRALIRVELGQVRVAEALEQARETAGLVISLATLHGADPSIWLLTDDHVTFVDGHEGASSFNAPPVFAPSFEQEAAMRRDRLSESLEQWSDGLASHLPLTRPDLRRAARLALWMRRARETWEPGRLVLFDRVFEQLAGRTGFGNPRRLISDYLRLAWALGRIRGEIVSAWSTVHGAGTGPLRFLEEEQWDEIASDPALEYESRPAGGWTVNLSGFLLRLDFVIARVPEESGLHERLSRLRADTANGRVTAAWLRRILADFDLLEARSRRVRNALVHGGPVGDQMAASVLSSSRGSRPKRSTRRWQGCSRSAT